MLRSAAPLLLALAGCSTADLAPPARPVVAGFEETPAGARFVVNGVRLGSTEEEARLALGSPEALPRRVLAGPAGARVLASFTVRAGRVASLDLELDGPPWVLMKAWVCLARSAQLAGQTCGPEGCRARGRPAGSSQVLVERRSSWPARLAVRDPGAPAESIPALARVR
jgi:hypothetical protein